jgi:hypothetical protein
MGINFQTFPKSMATPSGVLNAIQVFMNNDTVIDSHKQSDLKSNDVLAILREELVILGFEVEKGKAADQKIKVAVLYGLNGQTTKTFDADAFHREEGIVMEVEAGRAYTNYQFLKDLFQACAMQEARHLVIAVRKDYRGHKDFDAVINFMETLYASSRLQLPLQSVTIVGY